MATENKNQHKVQVGINLIFSRLFNLSARSFHNDWIVKTQSKKQESTLTKQHCLGKNYEKGKSAELPFKTGNLLEGRQHLEGVLTYYTIWEEAESIGCFTV